MKAAHMGDKKNNVEPLHKVVLAGKGTHENALTELLKLVQSVALSTTPPKGDAESWKEAPPGRRMVSAAEELDKGDKPSPEAIADYKKAVDCRACHSQHRPPPVKK